MGGFPSPRDDIREAAQERRGARQSRPGLVDACARHNYYQRRTAPPTANWRTQTLDTPQTTHSKGAPVSEGITYRQLKPFCLPTSLDDLSGPHTGSLRLPIHLCWSPGDHVFDLARLGDALTVYQCVIAEGTTQEQHEYLNHALLIELWPHLHLDVRIIAAWENTFDSLRGKNKWGRIHTTPTHSEE